MLATHSLLTSFRRIVGLCVVLSLAISVPVEARKEEPEKAPTSEKKTGLPTVEAKTQEFAKQSIDKKDGFVTIHLDRQKGQVWMEVPAPNDNGEALQLIYLEGLATGLGSNPVGLDRGQISDSKLITLRRVGEKVLFEQPNLAFRALSDNEQERRAVAQSFAPSVIWAAKIEAQDADGRSLINLSPFLLRDAHNVARTLETGNHGSFALDSARSAIDLDATLAFPDNVELEAVLTYSSGKPGDQVARTAPTADTFTVMQHHSFVRLPDDGYQTREFDPRMPSYGLTFQDYAVPLDQSIRRSWIYRHRLEKTDPSTERSTVKEPIVYYLDPGAPEPVRSALLDGARWWADAFNAAGLIDAYRVELLPEDVHPMDVRYNVIQWVHRSTRGWSYGTPLADPRTGEIIKGHVNLGSLRVRQDILLFEGLAGVEKTGTGAADDPVELALARIRQLAAHEVGHTLGFTHNFAASSYDDRASVMDYPTPLIGINEDGSFDFSKAYGVGIGTWDTLGVRFAYSEFAPEVDEIAALAEIVQEGLDGKMLFLSDADARPSRASDPRANLWDNGSDPVEELLHVLAVRRLALERFGEHNLAAGKPVALLQEVLAPVYFHHRFQLEAAAKVIGGMEYSYAFPGDGQVPTQPISAEQQRRALDALLSALDPQALDLPEAVLAMLAPRPFGYGSNRELFNSGTSPAFDSLGAAATVAGSITDYLTQPERLARLIDLHRRDQSLPSVDEVLGLFAERVFASVADEASRTGAIRQSVARSAAERLIARASNPNLSPEIRTWLEWTLRSAVSHLNHGREDVSRQGLIADIERFLEREHQFPTPGWTPDEPPPGSPIGQGEALWCSSGDYN